MGVPRSPIVSYWKTTGREVIIIPFDTTLSPEYEEKHEELITERVNALCEDTYTEFESLKENLMAEYLEKT